MRLRELAPGEVRAALRGPGLALHVPPVTVRIRGDVPSFAAQLRLLYGSHETRAAQDFADVDVRMIPGRGVRRVVRRTVDFVIDGITPFEPFPLDHALPMFEWGLNWAFAQRTQRFLLLHSAVVARDDRAVLLPAWPGSGKSTLAASLAARGWRYLSDEFGVVVPGTLRILPFPRPAALKNQSIEVLRHFAPGATIGPAFPGTRKGTVAHFAPPEASVEMAGRAARIALVVFPDFVADAPLTVQAMGPSAAFLKLAHNAFNYEDVGEDAFHTVAAIVRSTPFHILRYHDLDSAHRAIGDLLDARGRA